MVKLFIAFLSLLAGVASSTQGLFNGYWQDKLDLKTVLLVNSIVVLLFVVLIFLFSSSGGLKLSIEKMTPSIIVGGISGFIVIAILAVSFPVIGALATSLLFIVGLLVTSLIFDHLGVLNLTQRSIELPKIIGIGLVIIGTLLALKK